MAPSSFSQAYPDRSGTCFGASFRGPTTLHPHGSAQWHRRGFTLLELLITIVLIGIISGVAVTTLHGDSPEEEVEHFARTMAVRMSAARDFARHSGRAVSMELTADGWRAVPASSDGVGEAGADAALLLNLDFADTLSSGVIGQALNNVAFGVAASGGPSTGPAGLPLETSGSTIPGGRWTCLPDGTCAADSDASALVGDGGAIYLHHANEQSVTWAITINHMGRIRLWRFDTDESEWR